MSAPFLHGARQSVPAMGSIKRARNQVGSTSIYMRAAIGGERRQIGWIEYSAGIVGTLCNAALSLAQLRIDISRHLFQEPVTRRQPAAE